MQSMFIHLLRKKHIKIIKKERLIYYYIIYINDFYDLNLLNNKCE